MGSVAIAAEAKRAERAEKVWALKRGGASYPAIVRQLRAEGYRISLGTAYSDFQRELERHRVAPEEVKQWRELHVTRLEHMLAHAVTLAQTATKEADRVQALRTGVTILERQARLLGLDAPVRVEGEITVRNLDADDLVREMESILGAAPREIVELSRSEV